MFRRCNYNDIAAAAQHDDFVRIKQGTQTFASCSAPTLLPTDLKNKSSCCVSHLQVASDDAVAVQFADGLSNDVPTSSLLVFKSGRLSIDLTLGFNFCAFRLG